MNSRDNNPLISVIIPTYNREKSLGKAIQSVLDQTYSNIELIVVDDGSVDKTDELLGQFADKRLRVIRHKENKGVCAAKNTGLDNISGDWFFIADSDDTLQPNALEELINIPLNIDPEVNHITCNIVEYETNKFLGVGFSEDQHWDIETIFAKSRGEFKGRSWNQVYPLELFLRPASTCGINKNPVRAHIDVGVNVGRATESARQAVTHNFVFQIEPFFAINLASLFGLDCRYFFIQLFTDNR